MHVLLESYLHLLFPQLCLHCESETFSARRCLCKECTESLVLLDPKERCPLCCSFLEEGNCQRCSKYLPPLEKVVAACSAQGPANSLLKHLKNHQRPHLAKDAAAFMMVQWGKLDMPLPDLLVPVPKPFFRTLKRGYNRSVLLAETLGKWMQRPVVHLLKRKGGFPQTGQTRAQREQLSFFSFSLKDKRDLTDKTVLLVDDAAMTLTTISHCAVLLQRLKPHKVYALLFCLIE